MPATPIRIVPLTLSLAVLLLPEPAAADRLVLANGRVLEDVVVETSGESVRVHLGGGVLTLAPKQVQSIEEGESSVAEFAGRATALRRERPGARDWLELAQWARARAYDFGTRIAALEAAALEPDLPELATLLPPLGYERAPDGLWVPFDLAMRRRGWVEWQGEWLPVEIAKARADAASAERMAARQRAADARVARIATLTELKLLAELSRPEPPAFAYAPVWSAWGVPILVPPIELHGGGAGRPGGRWPPETASPAPVRPAPGPDLRGGEAPRPRG